MEVTPEVNVPLLVKFPAMVKSEFPEFVQVPEIVTSPSVFVPVGLLKSRVAPPVIVVAPVTVRLHLPTIGVPLGIEKVEATLICPVAAPAMVPLVILSVCRFNTAAALSVFKVPPLIVVAPETVCVNAPEARMPAVIVKLPLQVNAALAVAVPEDLLMVR